MEEDKYKSRLFDSLYYSRAGTYCRRRPVAPLSVLALTIYLTWQIVKIVRDQKYLSLLNWNIIVAAIYLLICVALIIRAYSEKEETAAKSPALADDKNWPEGEHYRLTPPPSSKSCSPMPAASPTVHMPAASPTVDMAVVGKRLKLTHEAPAAVIITTYFVYELLKLISALKHHHAVSIFLGVSTGLAAVAVVLSLLKFISWVRDHYKITQDAFDLTGDSTVEDAKKYFSQQEASFSPCTKTPTSSSPSPSPPSP
jgi:hypothetical protein